MKYLIFLSLFMLISPWASAVQKCFEDQLHITTPTTELTDNKDGTVTDTGAGLMWQRCSFGQTWNSSASACDGFALRRNWENALQAAMDSTYAKYTNWRIPNVKELASLVERNCVDPAINATIFPNTKSENYWTSSSDTNTPARAWSYAFYSGKNNTKAKTITLYVRMVRHLSNE
ncbi:Lcl C-terminal domain-containing protein [Algicola sagamiensis]|uniref:Lcl C-terminal domain-containing protein n=1 Tax=Algicola sagamiensis TaxID=163869 RepID=UPI000477F6D3|nr:DUF1566 domain-containing protein [Algicola sagamiensis]